MKLKKMVANAFPAIHVHQINWKKVVASLGFVTLVVQTLAMTMVANAFPAIHVHQTNAGLAVTNAFPATLVLQTRERLIAPRNLPAAVSLLVLV